jgi:hypothetical protein
VKVRPVLDEIFPGPVTRVAIPLAPGAEPNAMGNDQMFTWNDGVSTGEPPNLCDVVRTQPVCFISRWPERW